MLGCTLRLENDRTNSPSLLGKLGPLRIASPVERFMENTEEVFRQVLADEQDITDQYYDDRKLQQTASDKLPDQANFLAQIRKLMQDNGGIGQIAKAATPAIVRLIDKAHLIGNIGAVDATDAISAIDVTTRTVYACAVMTATATTLHDPRITMAMSHRQLPPVPSNQTTLLQAVEKIDKVAQDKSWTKALREYKVRVEALRAIKDLKLELVLVDGPLYTQTLLAHEIARQQVFTPMQANYTKLIGFIKDLSDVRLLHYAGLAMQPGEYWTVRTWRKLLDAKFEGARWGNVNDWLKDQTDWVRTVYRKNGRAFAFECHPDLVPIGLALIHSDITCAGSLNFEIPFLLETVDKRIRAMVDARAKAENLISDSPNYHQLTSEGTWR